MSRKRNRHNDADVDDVDVENVMIKTEEDIDVDEDWYKHDTTALPNRVSYDYQTSRPPELPEDPIIEEIKKSIRQEFQSVIETLREENKLIFEKIQNENNALKAQIKALINASLDQSAAIKYLSRQHDIDSNVTEKFPLMTIEDLSKIDETINESNENIYINTFRNLLAPDGLCKNLRKILSDDIFMACNVDGVQGKIALKGFTKFYASLIASIPVTAESGPSEKQLRKAVGLQKNRIFKMAHVNNYMKLKKMKKNENNDIEISNTYVQN